jgi:predicted RNase H-like HicB family nuclease
MPPSPRLLRLCVCDVDCIYMQTSHSYTLTIEKSEDGYVASFPALPGCYTAGTTYEEAILNAGDVVVGFLEALRLSGKPIPVEHRSDPLSPILIIDVPVTV